jgi:hypothetical protein
MNKLFLALLVLSFSGTELFSQDITKDFEINLPGYKVQNSLYNKIDFLDSRLDNTQIGIVGVGLLRGIDATLISTTPFNIQLASVFNSLIDSTAKDGEILFQLNQFNFKEETGSRYCYFNAALYFEKDARYKKIAYIDTVIIVTASNVTKALTVAGSNAINGFIARALLQGPSDSISYNINEVENMDSVEKQNILLYNAIKYTDGLYTSYTSFMKQQPDRQGIVDTRKDGSISSVKIIDSTGKKVKVKPATIYAVVDKGIPFIATEYGYYPLQKINNNFFFTGDVRIAASTGDMNSSGIILGLAGALLTKPGIEETFEMKIDYLNGVFIHIRAIPSTQ